MSSLETNVQAEYGQIGRRTVKGLIWLMGARVLNQVVALGIIALLARLLSKADFGIIGMATTITSFILIFTDFGTGMAIVQAPSLSDEQLSTIYWFNIVIGGILSLITILISPLVARFYNQPQLMLILSILGLGFLLNSFGVVFDALFRRRFEFSTLVKINIISTILAGIIAVVSALFGVGVWSLVIQLLTQYLINGVLLWIRSSWHPKLRWKRDDLTHIINFSLNLTGFNIVNYFARNTDYLLIGKLLGAEPLGLYTLAYRIMLLPVSNLSSIASQALYPAFSRLQSDKDRLSEAYLKSVRYIALITFPLMAGISLLSREVITIVYGSDWEGAILPLTYLALVGTFQPFISLYGTVILAQGFSSWYFRWGLIISTIMVVGFVIGIRWGISGVALSYLIGQIIVSIFGLPILFRKGGTSIVKFIQTIGLPVISTILMSVVIIITKHILLRTFSYNPIVILVIIMIVGSICYGIILLLQGRQLRQEVFVDLRSIFKRVD